MTVLARNNSRIQKESKIRETYDSLDLRPVIHQLLTLRYPWYINILCLTPLPPLFFPIIALPLLSQPTSPFSDA